jgi:GNAT superfamily N-acetyltransferase
MRAMTFDDVPAGLRLCRLSGWNQVAEDWNTFLEFSPGACRVAERGGAVAGTLATLRFGEAFSWIAMILVDPAVRGQGIGTELIREALAILKDEKCVRLDATEAGARIYRREGFVEEYRLTRMIAKIPVQSSDVEERSCMPISPNDLHEIFDRAPELAWVARTGATLDGYVFGRHGYHHEHVGPLAATSEGIARKLLSCCLAKQPKRSFLIDVPESWSDSLRSAGFVPERPLLRMYRGSKVWPPCEPYQFAIAGPEFG